MATASTRGERRRAKITLKKVVDIGVQPVQCAEFDGAAPPADEDIRERHALRKNESARRQCGEGGRLKRGGGRRRPAQPLQRAQARRTTAANAAPQERAKSPSPHPVGHAAARGGVTRARALHSFYSKPITAAAV